MAKLDGKEDEEVPSNFGLTKTIFQLLLSVDIVLIDATHQYEVSCRYGRFGSSRGG
jgi:hypothetical protein